MVVVGLELKDVACQFLYRADDSIVVLGEKTLEEHVLDVAVVGDKLLGLLEGGTLIRVRFSGDKAIAATGNKHIKCTVAEVLETRETSDKRK